MIDYLREFNIVTIIIRLFLACLCGSLLGLNREKQGRAAGLRTYYIVCLGSCAVMLLGQYLYVMLDTQWASLATKFGLKTDVTRLASQAVDGIGFLGAGSILLTRKNQVRGLTSAASLWASAALGLAIGAGFIELGVVGFLFMMIVLKLFSLIDNKTKDLHNKVRFAITFDDISHIARIINAIKADGVQIVDYDYTDNDVPYLEVQTILPRLYTAVDFMGNLYSMSFVKTVRKL